jgi:hypothetical protein
MIPPLATLETAPGSIVRSETFPQARGIFVGVSRGGSLWVAWRRCEAVATVSRPAETAEEWANKAHRMAERLALFASRDALKQARRN